MDIPSRIIGRDYVVRLVDFYFLGVHIKEDLTWNVITSELIKKIAKQRL